MALRRKPFEERRASQRELSRREYLQGEESSLERTARETGAPQSCLLVEQISRERAGIAGDLRIFEI
jgi:hypothetical protein